MISRQLMSTLSPLVLLMSVMHGTVLADELDDLLAPSTDAAGLVDGSATDSWNVIVDAFRKNELKKASELGRAFLESNFSPSPYQLLGVKVMVGLADAENPMVSQDAALTIESEGLAVERGRIVAKYNQLQQTAKDANARINKLTNNRKTAVQAGTAAYQECMRCDEILNQANAEIDAMQPSIDEFKRKADDAKLRQRTRLKSDTIQLLDMLTEADEIEAAFAVANVYLRVVGSDLDVARKQQTVITMQAVQQKANKIAGVIEGQQKSLVAEKKYWSARETGKQSVAKVQQQANDEVLARMVTRRLEIDTHLVNATISKAESEAAAIRKLAKTDALKASVILDKFRSSYPDCPDTDALAIEIGGYRSGEMKGKLADLVASIEQLAGSDTKQAFEFLAKLEDPDIDPIERLALEARISNARSKLITALIKELSGKVEAVKNNLGDEVQEFFLTNREKIKTGWFDSRQSELTTSVKIKIRGSTGMPEIRANLEGLKATVSKIQNMKLSEAQAIRMNEIETEVDALQTVTR